MIKHKIQNKSKCQIPIDKTLVLIFVIWILNLFCHLDFSICYFCSLNCDYAYAQDNPKEAEALFVAQKAFEDGFYEVSLGLLERFLKNYPNSSKIPEVNLLIGRCYFQQNKFLEALAKFEELLNQAQAKGIKDAVLYWIAEVHFKGNNFSKAGTYYRKVIEEFPNSAYAVSAYYSLGWCLFQEAKFEEALNYFKIVEEKFPQENLSQDARFKIIECLYNLRNYKEIKERTNSYLKIYAKDKNKTAYLYFYLAEADYYLNNFNQAIEEYNKSISLEPEEKIRILSYVGKVWAHLKLKQYPQAESIFSEIKIENLEKSSKEVLLLAKAILMAETKRFTEAKQIYQELIELSSDPLVLVQAHIGKADAFYNLSEYKEAIKEYRVAHQNLSGTIPQEIIDKLHYGLAWALLKEGEFKEAIDEFQKIVKQTEDKIMKISTLCQIADTYQDTGDFEKAISTYDTILKDYPDSLYSDYVQYQLGLTLLKASKYDGAIIAFQNLKTKFPNSKLLDDATYALGLAYFQREDYLTSQEIFKQFQEEFKESNLRPQGMYLWATSLYNLGRFSEAIEVFKEIMRAYSQDTELMAKVEYEIADCYYQLGNEQEALNRFKALRSKYPDSSLNAEVIWWLGQYYYRMRDLNLARRYFSSLIQDFPQSSLVASCYYAIGSTYAEEENYPEAINNFQKVFSLGKSDIAAQAKISLADIYAKEKNLDLALKFYKEVAQDYVHLVGLVYPKIAEIYQELNEYEEALDFYQKSLEIVPLHEMSQIQFKIAEVYQAQGKFSEAIENYLKVAYLYSEDSALTVKALLRVASIYEDKEELKEAVNIYRRIIGMNVEEAKYAKERLDLLERRIK